MFYADVKAPMHSKATSTVDEPLSPTLIDQLKKRHSSAMPVIDPEGPNTGVYTIFLPWEAVYFTQGFQRLLKRKKPHPSLCMLYQRGKCRASVKCNQVHAHLAVVADLRGQGQHDCCLSHGDTPSNDQNFLFTYLLQKGDFLLTLASKKKVPVPWEKLARTACMDKMLEKKGDPSKPLKFGTSYVCRLHQDEKCRYGQDCHHMHVCREFWSKLVEEHPSLQKDLAQNSKKDTYDSDEGTESPLAHPGTPTDSDTAVALYGLTEARALPKTSSTPIIRFVASSMTDIASGKTSCRSSTSAPDLIAKPRGVHELPTGLDAKAAAWDALCPPLCASSAAVGPFSSPSSFSQVSGDAAGHSSTQSTTNGMGAPIPREPTSSPFAGSCQEDKVHLGNPLESSSQCSMESVLQSFNEGMRSRSVDEPKRNNSGNNLKSLLNEALYQGVLPNMLGDAPSPAASAKGAVPWSAFDFLLHSQKGGMTTSPEVKGQPCCQIYVEESRQTVEVPLTEGKATLADIRQRLKLDNPFVFVVDNDVITCFEEKYLNVSKLAESSVSVRGLSSI